MVLNALGSASMGNDVGIRTGLGNLADKLGTPSNSKVNAKSINTQLINNTQQVNFEGFIAHQLNADKLKNLKTEDFRNQLADIKKLGGAVKKYFTPGVMTDYLTAVHSFLTDIKDKAYEGENSEDGFFERIKIVDEELDQMAKDYFQDQSGELKIAASLDLVEGMLVDLIA
jgi:uncharacterized protein YaaR (DUF327 family)